MLLITSSSLSFSSKLNLSNNDFVKIAKLYNKHAEMEVNIGSLEVSEIADYYLEKAYEYYQKANELFSQLEAYTEVSKRDHESVIKHLIEIAGVLNKPDDVQVYAVYHSGLIELKPLITLNPLFSVPSQ